MRKIEYLGYTDAFRARHPEPGQYTFWDYQAGSWRKNQGIRIDHIMLSPGRKTTCWELAASTREVREGEKPSDHVPIWSRLDLDLSPADPESR